MQSQWLPAAISTEVKQSGIEANHPHLSTAEFMKAWSHIFSWVGA
jgi:hypothetical protein